MDEDQNKTNPEFGIQYNGEEIDYVVGRGSDLEFSVIDQNNLDFSIKIVAETDNGETPYLYSSYDSTTQKTIIQNYPQIDGSDYTVKITISGIGDTLGDRTILPVSGTEEGHRETSATFQIDICFLGGTLIHTPFGTKTVESIQIGDDILAYDWQNDTTTSRVVTWVGSKKTQVRLNLPDDEAGYPVRILKDAIADGVPYKDMLITPEHCLFFEDKFVPVRMLVNGVSIFYDKCITSYNYYHIETEQHSVIIADGMLTESYLDTGNRGTFRQEGKIVSLHGTIRSWEEDAGAPLCVDRTLIEPLYLNLRARGISIAGSQQFNEDTLVVTDAALHLVTEKGITIHPIRRNGQCYSFILPANTPYVRIVSRASRPVDVIGPFMNDRRLMGVAVADVYLFLAQQKYPVTSHLKTEKPQGWHDTDWKDCAWTNGNAILPLDEYLTHGKMAILSMVIRAAGPYRIDTPQKTNSKTRYI